MPRRDRCARACWHGVQSLVVYSVTGYFEDAARSAAGSAASSRRAVGAVDPEGHAAKASCHSDYADPDEARERQARGLGKVVQINTAPAHNLPSHDPLL